MNIPGRRSRSQPVPALHPVKVHFDSYPALRSSLTVNGGPLTGYGLARQREHPATEPHSSYGNPHR